MYMATLKIKDLVHVNPLGPGHRKTQITTESIMDICSFSLKIDRIFIVFSTITFLVKFGVILVMGHF